MGVPHRDRSATVQFFKIVQEDLIGAVECKTCECALVSWELEGLTKLGASVADWLWRWGLLLDGERCVTDQ